MSLTLYFLRHGETTHSQTGGYCGATDIPLTDSGKEMAAGFAQVYQAIPWTAIYVSPMQRTIATAKPLCDKIGMAMELREGLKELNFGQWENKSPEWVKENYLDDYINWMTEPAWNPPTGGETGVEVSTRAMIVVSEIENKHSQGNVLVVSHKTTIRLILCNLLGIDLGRYRDRIDMLTASVSIVKFGAHGPLLQRLGDRSHLSPELVARAGT